MEERQLLHESSWLIALKLIAKLLLFLFVLLVIFIVGLFIGYCIIGDGNFWEVLNRDTWIHIVDFIK